MSPAKETVENSATKPNIGAETDKDLIEIDSTEHVSLSKARDSRETGAVILAALRWVQKHRVGFGNFLEPFLSVRRFVAVRMIPERELPEGVLDCGLIGVTWDAKDLVVIPFC